MLPCSCAPTPTSDLADVQDVSDDVLGDLGGRLSPGDVDGVSGHGAGRQALRSSGEILGLSHGQSGAGLVGAGAVLRDALIDGFVLRGDPSQSQSAAEDKHRNSISLQSSSETEHL